MTNLNVRPETLRPYSSGWLVPDANEIRQLIKLINLSGSELGKLVGVSSRTVRKWVAGEVSIPFAAWAIMVEYYTGQKIWGISEG